jgi:hypothetical protein
MNTPLLIGQSTVYYDEAGAVTKVLFAPKIDVSADRSFLEGLSSIATTDDTDKLRLNSELVMSRWFNDVYDTLDEIETMDRDKYYIHAEILSCEKWPNGLASKCVIEYSVQSVVY